MHCLPGSASAGAQLTFSAGASPRQVYSALTLPTQMFFAAGSGSGYGPAGQQCGKDQQQHTCLTGVLRLLALMPTCIS